jgi:hypothetical protein
MNFDLPCRRSGLPSPMPSCSAQAEHPVRRGFSVKHRCLWNTGSSAFADDDSEQAKTPAQNTKFVSVFKRLTVSSPFGKNILLSYFQKMC